MRRLLIVSSFALVLGGRSEIALAQGEGRLAQLGWLAGCWERSIGSRLVEEQWMRPRGGLMLGAGRTVEKDSLVEFEQVRMLERDGRLVYAAAPSGQTPAEFTSILVTDSAVTFENLAHDFPQRVIYRRTAVDSVVARVEGVRKGRVRGNDFAYRRATCQ
ncbi:MAG TPA: DUF6265 family protein [Gemmatimonadales bacterium]|nr:DUF6265 family protein [Gemmatimonadales bacterium]